jgi:hypothetical protein
VTEYQKERLQKQAFINENVIAQGFEIEDFLALLAKEKGKLILLDKHIRSRA